MRDATSPNRAALGLAALLAAGQIAILGPLAVWSDNRDSFADFSNPAGLTLGVALLALVALFAAPGLLVPRLATRLTAALFALTLLMWGQAFLSGRLLTGEDVAAPEASLRDLGEGLVWIVVLLAAFVSGKRCSRFLGRAALFVVVIQALTLGWSAMTAESDRNGVAANRMEHLDHLATLSQARNIIVLVLDGTHRDFVSEALKSHPDLASGFAGFRVFTDHIGTFPTTRFSIPAMLSGVNYDNTVPGKTYLDSTLVKGRSLPRRLQKAGWDVGIASTVRAILVAPADAKLSVDRYVKQHRSVRALGLELLDLSAFRHTPGRLRTWIYNSDSWRLRQFSDAARKNYHSVRSRDFIADFLPLTRADSTEPVFRFIHVGGAHPPVVVDSDCRFIGVQEAKVEAYGEQVECALRQALSLVDRLRELGILDRTAIVVASDHGIKIEGDASRIDPVGTVLERASATLLVKGFAATEPVVFDSAPTSIADISEIIMRLARGDEPYLPPGAMPGRLRSFFFHEWQNSDWRKPYLTALHSFEVGPGSASRDAWSYTGTTPSPELGPKERARVLREAARDFASEPPGQSPDP